MNFLDRFVRAFQLMPAIISGIEGLFSGQKRGKEKADAAADAAKMMLGFTESIAQKDIVDEEGFAEAIKQINDGIVKALNASIWHKK